jgi:hypothetical protein
MKKIIFTLISITCFVTIWSFRSKTDISQEQEKEAIIAAINEETNAYYDRDYERMAAVHVQNEYNTRINVGKWGFGHEAGWESYDQLKEFMKNLPDPGLAKEVKSNFRIKVYPESAWAIYDNEYYDTEGNLDGKGLHVQFLEKHDGEWKTIFLSIYDTDSFDKAQHNLEVSLKYHELNPENINEILADNFIGQNEHQRFTWTKENHMNYWSNNRGIAKDTILYQLANANWVASMVERKMRWNGQDIQAQGMNFKRFENGKIAELWEFGDSKQWETSTEVSK